jgi:phosphatidylinositol alpha-1,6-mannosyltransferase
MHIDCSGVLKVQCDDLAVVTHLSENCRKIEESTESILDEVLVGVEAFYEKYNFQLNPFGVDCLATINNLLSGATTTPGQTPEHHVELRLPIELVSRQSILVVTRNFPPLTGGMERLMQHCVETLASRFDVTLIGPSGCSEFAPHNVAVIECPQSPFGYLTTAVFKGMGPAKQHSFDLVLGGSGLVAPVTWFLAKIAKARSAVHVHGLDLVVENLIYQKLFVPFIRRHDCVIANSLNTRDIAIDKGCPEENLRVVNPGAAIPPQKSADEVAKARDDLGFADRKIVLFVGRMVRRKGLAEFLESAWPEIVARVPDAMLLVAGDKPDDALLQDADGGKRLLKAIDNTGKDTVTFLGTVGDEVLWNCYAAADALVFPLIRVSGDVEGFGMVAIEAAASGTPTVAFPVGGVVDAVADGVNGVLVNEGDYPAFADAVVSICQGGPPGAESCRAHAENFSWPAHGLKLMNALDLGVEQTGR